MEPLGKKYSNSKLGVHIHYLNSSKKIEKRENGEVEKEVTPSRISEISCKFTVHHYYDR